MIARFLAWLRRWVIPESSSVVRTTSRRGSRTCGMPCYGGRYRRHIGPMTSEAKRAAQCRMSGLCSASARTVHPRTVATTATNTTPGTGGSPDPDSAVPASETLRLPTECGACGRPWDGKRCFTCRLLQHNPRNGVDSRHASGPETARVDWRKRGMFGMRDYPEKENAPGPGS